MLSNERIILLKISIPNQTLNLMWEMKILVWKRTHWINKWWKKSQRFQASIIYKKERNIKIKKNKIYIEKIWASPLHTTDFNSFDSMVTIHTSITYTTRIKLKPIWWYSFVVYFQSIEHACTYTHILYILSYTARYVGNVY